MVSVNEKCFIENLACENAIKSHSHRKLFLKDKKECCSSDDSLINQTPNSSDIYSYNHSNDSLVEVRRKSVDEGDFKNGKTRLNHPGSSEGQKPKRRIVWDNHIIYNINNILSNGDLNSPKSISSCDNNLNISTDSLNTTVDKIVECDHKTGDINWDELSTPQPQETTLYHKSRDRKKPFYSRNEDRRIFKKSKVRNISIQPLDANWKYESVDYDEIVFKIEERMTGIKDWVKNHEPKISLIGDSHTRYLADIITEMLPGFIIEDSVKPGARSRQVLSSFRNVLQYMGENDFLVTLSGTNDMWSEALDEAKTVVYNAVMEAKYTNLLLCNVPNNYLEPEHSNVHDNITNFNQFYEDVVNFSKWAHLVNLHQLKDRSFFTRHGLHFNLHGKIKICELVSNKILDIIDLIKT